MSKQVLSIEQMQHLKELGVDTSKTMMCYRRITRDFRGEEKVGRWSLVINRPIIVSNFETYEEVPNFTLQDILDLLPEEILTDEYKGKLCIECVSHGVKWIVSYKELSVVVSYFCNNNLIDAAYEMLCWCIENGYIKTNKEE